MPKFEIEILIQFEADSIEDADQHWEELCDIIGESGFEAMEAEISPAIEEQY
jgi:hypothetical protein